MKPSNIIDHTSPSSVKAQKAAGLPIARTSGPGYERPERARTSHACEPCRERKTKCDGERPSCRRCLHTGTNCHYGYGKGWRKRKTAEDLNATSKKLQRYEALLTDITPMVPPEVRAMIDEVRRQESPPNSASETNESSTPSMSASLTPSLSIERERSGSGPQTRIPLTLPVPGTLLPHQSRAQPALPFDRVSESTSPHLAHHPKPEVSYDDPAGNRLPSITPNGVLIENAPRDLSPTFPRPTVPSGHGAAEHFSPSGSSYGPGYTGHNADERARSHASSTFRLSESFHPLHQHVLPATRLTA